MKDNDKPYCGIVLSDLNGFMGLMFDNVTVLSFLAAILILGFGYPKEIVYSRMFPGTALGVLFGDLVYTWMAYRLAKRTGNPNVTAMPLGLDTPSTIGIAVAILGPTFLDLKQNGMDPNQAAMMTWYVGMATMVLVGLFKFAMSFCGSWVQRIVPQAGLLGSLAGIGLALIGFLPLVEVFGLPLVGMVSLGLILYTVVARIRLPMGFPGVLGAIIAGTALYHLLGGLGWTGGLQYSVPKANVTVGFPIPTLDFVQGIGLALKYLPLALPFALLTIVGGINVTESARVAGDNFDTRSILLTEAVATILAGLCGGVAQSTPYIGHPAYKRMGARAGYTLLTGLFIGLGGILGYVSFIVELIPSAVLAPILIFVALEIMVQAFQACPVRHAPAVAFAYLPTVAQMVAIKLKNPELVPIATRNALLDASGKSLPEVLVTIALGNGFILTAMLWGGFLAELIDRRLVRSALYLFILSALTFFGVIHSASLDGNVYLPWTLKGFARQIPFQFALGYAAVGLMFLCLSRTSESKETCPEDSNQEA